MARSDIAKAREILEREREAVLADLREAGAEARAAAEQQRIWRAQAAALLDRGREAGLSIKEMAHALGLSRQWSTYLLRTRTRKQLVDELRQRGPAGRS